MKCPHCKPGTMHETATHHECRRAQAFFYLCANRECAKVKVLVMRRQATKPDERLRSKMVAKAQRLAADVKTGHLVRRGNLWIWPADKGGPGGERV